MGTYYSFLNKLALLALMILCVVYFPQRVLAATPEIKPSACWWINAELVNNLSLPKNPEALRRAYKELPYHDVLLDMLYYTRLRTMQHTEKDDLDFLKSMPKNPTEFWFLYYVTWPEVIEHFPQLNNAYTSYFEDLADLVVKHPAFLQDYFLQYYFSDGEVAESLEGQIEKIRKAIPKEFNSALKKAPPQVRAQISTD
jgi:hypothetical protein